MAELNGGNTADKVISDIQEILAGNFYEFLEVKGSTITFVTKNDVINTYVKPSASIDLSVNLGKFKIMFDMNSLAIMVKEHSGNTMVDQHYHPHVGNRGTVCWGNASQHSQDLLQKMAVKEALVLLATLLTTYNESAPYVTLGHFKQKQDDLAGIPRPGVMPTGSLSNSNVPF
jgi:hypothetical protein